MNKKHKEHREGKPQLGDRSKHHPGCSAYMDTNYFNLKSSQAKSRDQPRPRFLTKHDLTWTEWIKKMRESGLTDQDVSEVVAKQVYKLTKEVTVKFQQTCPVQRKNLGDPKCVSYYEYCPATEGEMDQFFFSKLEGLPMPSSKDMFADQNCGAFESSTNHPIRAGWIYLITSSHDNIIKIGRAGEDCLEGRVKEAQRQRRGAALYYAALVSNYKSIEIFLHKQCKDYKCEGNQRELFILNNRQIEAIKKHLSEIAHQDIL